MIAQRGAPRWLPRTTRRTLGLPPRRPQAVIQRDLREAERAMRRALSIYGPVAPETQASGRRVGALRNEAEYRELLGYNWLAAPGPRTLAELARVLPDDTGWLAQRRTALGLTTTEGDA